MVTGKGELIHTAMLKTVGGRMLHRTTLLIVAIAAAAVACTDEHPPALVGQWEYGNIGAPDDDLGNWLTFSIQMVLAEDGSLALTEEQVIDRTERAAAIARMAGYADFHRQRTGHWRVRDTEDGRKRLCLEWPEYGDVLCGSIVASADSIVFTPELDLGGTANERGTLFTPAPHVFHRAR